MHYVYSQINTLDLFLVKFLKKIYVHFQEGVKNRLKLKWTTVIKFAVELCFEPSTADSILPESEGAYWLWSVISERKQSHSKQSPISFWWRRVWMKQVLPKDMMHKQQWQIQQKCKKYQVEQCKSGHCKGHFFTHWMTKNHQVQ